MSYVTTKDGVQIFYKDWGPRDAPVIHFHHGWPLSADDWDAQMLFFLAKGFRVVAHDRRGHGRSSQVWTATTWTTMPTMWQPWSPTSAPRARCMSATPPGGGEVVRYMARHPGDPVAKAVLIAAVPPLMVQTPANPGGLPKSVFDGFQAQVASNRAQFYRDVPTGPFYGYNRPGVEASEGIIGNWWRQGMIGSAKAHYDGIVAFSQTDFTEDLKGIKQPVLVMHGDDDQIVPYENLRSAVGQVAAQWHLEDLQGYPHGMPTTHADVINADLLAFIQS